MPNTTVSGFSPQNVKRAEILLVVTMLAATLWMLGNLIAGVPPTGPDSRDHMQWITQFTQQVDAGIWYPRWMSQSFGGFGLPIFYIYPPLAYYAAWIVHTLNASWQAEDLYRILSVVVLLLSGATSYAYFRRYTTRRHALIAAMIYCGLPYRYWDVMIRCAYSESFVFIFIPLLLIVVDRVFDDRSIATRNVAWIAILTALLFFTSAPTVAVLSVAIPIYCFAKWWTARPPLSPILTQLISGAALGALCSSIWILPAFATRPLLQTDLAYDPGFGRMYDILGIFYVNRSNLIYVPMLMAVIGYLVIPIFWGSRKPLSATVKPWLWLGIAIVFLQLPLSWPLWNIIPMLRVAQFSSRFGIMMCLVLPIAYMSIQSTRSRILVLLAMSALTIYANVHAYPSLVESWRFKGYDNFHPPTMDAFEYLPKTVESGGWKTHLLGLAGSTPEIQWSGDSTTITNVKRSYIRTDFDVHSTMPTSVTVARFAFPYWKLFADSTEIAYVHAEHGFIRATLPPGRYHATLKLIPSPAEQRGERLSLIGAAILCSLLGVAFVRRKR